MQGQVFLKGWVGGGGGGGRGAGTFPILFFQCLSFLHLEITLCKVLMQLKKKFFFCQHNFMKKGHSTLSKNEPENIP